MTDNISFKTTDFQQVDLISIPDIFYRRFKTGIETIDTLLGGQGFLPGSTFTITGPPGSGKTTLLLQILDALQKNGKMAAYASGEESMYQLAYNCKRLNIQGVQVANLTDVDEIAKQIKNFDILIVDSFQFVTCKHIDKPLKTQIYATKILIEAAQKNECVLGIIQHLTSGGKAKGGTLLPHAVDANLEITKDESNINHKIISVSKNRFGNIGELCLEMTPTGFNFEQIIEEEQTPKILKALQEGKKEQQTIIDFITSQKEANLEIIMNSTKIVAWRVPHYLRSLVKSGEIEKIGRGDDAFWVLPNQ